MDAVLRGLVIYFFLLLVFRLAGKRTLSQISTFDFILLLIISETTQQAMLGDDFSITNAALLILTLVGMDLLLAFIKDKSTWFDNVTEGIPVLLIENGEIIEEHLKKTRVDTDDILSRARELQGLERLDQIKYAVLERSGSITVIPKER